MSFSRPFTLGAGIEEREVRSVIDAVDSSRRIKLEVSSKPFLSAYTHISRKIVQREGHGNILIVTFSLRMIVLLSTGLKKNSKFHSVSYLVARLLSTVQLSYQISVQGTKYLS
jgi:hypothetical protein